MYACEPAMRIHHFQHVPFEGLAYIRQWCDDNGHRVTGTRWYAGEVAPDVDDVNLLIVMGGPMGVHDEGAHPWLTAEKRAIEKALSRGVPVLGICLGAQLLADVLGARVRRNEYLEIGWHRVALTPAARTSSVFGGLPEVILPFHWHGDTFEIPPGTQRMAGSEACVNQAFADDGGTIVGLQFHPEATRDSVRHLIEHGAGDLRAGGAWVQDETAMSDVDEGVVTSANGVMAQILARMASPGRR